MFPFFQRSSVLYEVIPFVVNQKLESTFVGPCYPCTVLVVAISQINLAIIQHVLTGHNESHYSDFDQPKIVIQRRKKR